MSFTWMEKPASTMSKFGELKNFVSKGKCAATVKQSLYEAHCLVNQVKGPYNADDRIVNAES